MKHNHLTVTIGIAATAAIFILLFAIGFTLLHQIVNFFATNQGNGLYGNGYIKH